jgi:DNA repair protein RecN (Recombination protein N)
MLLHLNIRNFAIVPELEQDFLPGFTAISGETGAGKSILVDALGLLLGDRSDASWVRAGMGRAELSAEFDVANNPEARAWLNRNELSDYGQCLLRRTIRDNGRSSAWINGTPATVAQLSELGNLLVEVHGQNEHVRLTGRRRQLELLDQGGAYRGQLDAVREAFEAWKLLREQLQAMETQTALPPAEADFLRHQFKELERVALPAEQVAELEQEHRVLANAGDLLEALAAADEALDNEQAGALHQLATALGHIDSYRDMDKDITDAARMLDEALVVAQEAGSSLRRALNRIDLNPERLQETAAALSALGGLARKHGVRLEELEAVRDRIAQRLALAEDSAGQREQLGKQLAAAEKAYREAATALSAARRKHARALASQVATVMAELGMAGGQFHIELAHDSQAQPGALGDDRAEILVSANAGLPPAPLSKVASGGELSRISLAIKVVSAAADGRTQVFDEIDSGVGGDTANAVGRLLKKAAGKGQALCVTHLAQVAVRADQQLQVMKQASSDSTEVAARLLDDTARVEEIARMLGGKVSAQSRAHAQEMLEAARNTLQ